MNRPVDSIPAAFLPIDTPPSPDLDLNANLSPRVLGVSAFLFVISFTVVSLRFIGRYLSKAGIWWDDWLCLAAMLVSWGTCILCFVSPNYNFGKHEAALSITDAITDSQSFFKSLYAYETLYTIAITLAKFSIILFYARIFTERSFRIALWAVSALVMIWYIAVQIVQLVQCRPISALWDGTYAENCIDLVRMFVIAGVINCILNFVLLVMPLPMIWGLEIHTKAKIGLCMTFLLGIFVFAVSAARLSIVNQLKQVDVTWTYVDAAIWTTVEPNIAVVSASLPILRSLWILFNPKRSVHNSTTHSRSAHKSSRFPDGANTEKTVAFADSNAPKSLADEDPDASLFRGISTRTKASVHHNTPTSSAFSNKADHNGNDLVSPAYDGGYMSPGGVSDMTGPPTAGFPASAHLSRKSTVAGRSEDSMTPLTEASELPAHRSIPYGGSEYARYTVNISSESSSRSVSAKPSIASRMGVKSPRLGGSSPRAGGTSSRGSWSNREDDASSIEMTKLPIQGGRQAQPARKTPSPGPKGPLNIERIVGANLRSTHQRGGSQRDSGSLTGYPPVAELYA